MMVDLGNKKFIPCGGCKYDDKREPGRSVAVSESTKDIYTEIPYLATTLHSTDNKTNKRSGTL